LKPRATIIKPLWGFVPDRFALCTPGSGAHNEYLLNIYLLSLPILKKLPCPLLRPFRRGKKAAGPFHAALTGKRRTQRKSAQHSPAFFAAFCETAVFIAHLVRHVKS
jgi:hypothetical protein